MAGLLEESRRRSAFRPRVTVGAVPGQLVSRDGSARGKIRIISYNARSHSDVELESIDELAIAGNESRVKPRRADDHVANNSGPPSHTSTKRDEVVWLNVIGVEDVHLLGELGKKFGIHPLALEDVVNVHQHAKLECYGETLFFVARMPTGDNGFETEQVSMFLVDGVIITIQQHAGDCLDPVRYRIANKLGRIHKRGADYLAYAIIDAIIDSYFPVLQRYAEDLDHCSQTLKGQGDKSLPLHLHDVRADLLLVRKVVNQHRNALHNLLREGADLLSSDTAIYFRDCQDHIHQLLEAADTDRETCGELRELYFAMLGEKNNDVMKVLTIIATIFIPMSFVAGIYGMNFDGEASQLNMPELHWAYGYPFAIGLMSVMAGGLVVYLYKKGWLTS